MPLVFISDTRLRHAFTVPDDDVLVHCGDFTMKGNAGEIKRFDAWLETLPHKYKIVTPETTISDSMTAAGQREDCSALASARAWRRFVQAQALVQEMAFGTNG